MFEYEELPVSGDWDSFYHCNSLELIDVSLTGQISLFIYTEKWSKSVAGFLVFKLYSPKL